MSACVYNFKPGWYCSRRKWHTGRCILRPRWWNVFGILVYRYF